jgi:starch-binding outer membrane protein, SusD/RagB family
MKNIKNLILFSLTLVLVVFESCTKDLERQDPFNLTSDTVYGSASGYRSLLAKIYAGLALTGNQGPAGKGDIAGIDEGESSYLRMLFYTQELSTDEAVCGWTDKTIKDFHFMKWSSSDKFIEAIYYRIYFQITLCNELIRETSDEKLSSRGLSGDAQIKAYRTEARLLRALSYWHALDLFGNVPFITDKDPLGAFLPPQSTKADLFSYIETELKALENELSAPKANEYGRVDKATAWTILAKLYLNAEVYTGQSKATDCITYCNKIIGAGYALDPNYANLFKIGNEKSNEIIFAIRFDGLRSKTYGGMTFLVHAPVGGTMRAADFGINGGWNGVRTTKDFVALFNNAQSKIDTNDVRASFYTDGQTLDIEEITTDFTQGYGVIKYKNVDVSGKAGSDPTGDFPDTDYPMFRLADVHLMYAEAVLRGGTGGTQAQALTYVNALRKRSNKGTYNNLTALTLNDILNERGRELYWESHRRTDLIRFKKFTSGDYLWQWKGGVKGGKGVSEDLNLYPIPSSDLIANPTLKQNKGY